MHVARPNHWRIVLPLVGLILVAACDDAPQAVVPAAPPTSVATAAQKPTVPAPTAAATVGATSPAPAAKPVDGVHKVDIGGYGLILNCAGQGSPTIVLGHGIYATYGQWETIQPELAATTRVCSYNRAGVSGSGRNKQQPNTLVNATTELHTLLTTAGEQGPYLLVGESFGGLLMRMFAATYPKETAGVVMLNARHPDEIARYTAVLPPSSASDDKDFKLFRRQATEFGQTESPEGLKWTDSLAQARTAPSLGALPLVVVHGARLVPPGAPANIVQSVTDTFLGMQRDFLTLSSASREVVAERVTGLGGVADTQPDLVVSTVKELTQQLHTQ